MWCDNCLLIFPLRVGSMAWNIFIALYSLAGSIVLFRYGQFLYFDFPEWQIYGGIGMAVMSICVISIIAMANRNYMFARLVFVLWPIVLVTTAVRAAVMIFQLNRQQNKIIWECNNGGKLWPESDQAGYSSSTTTMPGGMCSSGFHSLYIAFVLSLLIDWICQLYAYFLSWRYRARIEHEYNRVSTKTFGAYA